jgi:hypothetical protein
VILVNKTRRSWKHTVIQAGRGRRRQALLMEVGVSYMVCAAHPWKRNRLSCVCAFAGGQLQVLGAAAEHEPMQEDRHDEQPGQ